MSPVGIACAQEIAADTVQVTPDTVQVEVDTVAARIRTRTGYVGGVRGDVSRISMNNELTAVLRMARRWRINGRLGLSESIYRLQDRHDEAKSISTQLTLPLNQHFTVTGSAADRQFFNRAVTFSGGVQNFRNNVQKADTRISYQNVYATGLNVNTWGEVGATNSEQTFMDDLFQEGLVAGDVGYTLLNDRVSFSGRGFLRRTASEVHAGQVTYSGLGIGEDSLGTNISVSVTEKASVGAYYHRFAYSNRFMDLPRGVFLEQQFTQDLVPEHESRTAEILMANAVLNPNGRLRFVFGLERSELTNRFVTAFKRNSDLITDGVRAQIVYDIRANAAARFVIDRSEVLHDLGENSLGTYTDKRQALRAIFNYRPTETLGLQLGLGTTLLQNFYKDYDINPRDRDQMDQSVDFRITSRPFPKLTAQIGLAARQVDYVNMSSTLSQGNRQEISYDFRPEWTYKITERIDLRQQYGLNIEFTDFVFTEEENFLDRNFTFANNLKVQLTPRLSTVFDYSLLLHDRGSYLAPSPGAERLLTIEQEDRRERVALRFRYDVNPHLALLGGHDFTTRQATTPGRPAPAPFEEGGLEVGAEGNYDWTRGRNFRFRLVKVNRFGRFNSPEQQDYWVMDSTLNFHF
jgi:hypothetical protein